jgi:hypothetical protein
VRLLSGLRLKLKLRLIGLSVSHLSPYNPKNGDQDAARAFLTLPGVERAGETDSFLPPGLDSRREMALDKALDKVRNKFGTNAVVRGKLFNQDKGSFDEHGKNEPL